ncbi:DENN (AEX-3) domain protein (macronuclear) [Tetrahymena thermophila SB210]|uniref:DENN (AEX-3) domain protein n=1 Tax=Tetrahymena thermophila (strain SB210) TaxID=312017 RepID=I7M2M0_TETTS|nr:DENN (AEX-3) domain protein [Tetrahymena thermophila SB210]EAS00793.2 DENN (AEX-3) domain protein [Tetrahymena thermophila SB210]|eukprot:XP_001021038.2 DENN (AEX-3) domain protein [Tetrahymena thermophila SB210]
MNTKEGLSKDKDQQFIKSLLDASEKHNKNLSELIVILKKNIEEEKSKVQKLTKENVDLKKELQQKGLHLKKAEKEIIAFKQNEQKQNGIIKGLQDNLEKYRLQLNNYFLKSKVDESSSTSINSAVSIQNTDKSSITATNTQLKYNYSTFLNGQDGKENSTNQFTKKGNGKNNDFYKEVTDQANPSLTNVLSATSIQQSQSKASKHAVSKTPNQSDKENSSMITYGKHSLESNESKRKPFYSIHQSSSNSVYQNVLAGTKIKQNSSMSFNQEDSIQNNLQFQNQKISLNIEKCDNNLKDCSNLEIEKQQISNDNNSISLQKKKNTFYSSKSAVQSKTNLQVNQNSSQSTVIQSQIPLNYNQQQTQHTRQASDNINQKIYNQQIYKNLSPSHSQNSSYLSSNLNNPQNNILIQNDQIATLQYNQIKEDQQAQQQIIQKNLGVNSVMNYLSKAGQNPIFKANSIRKEKDFVNTAIGSNNKNANNVNNNNEQVNQNSNSSENDIKLIIVSNQSQIYSPNNKNKSQCDEQFENKNNKIENEKFEVKQGNQVSQVTQNQQNSFSNYQSSKPAQQQNNQFGKSKFIFQDQVYSTAAYNPNNQNQTQDFNTFEFNNQANVLNKKFSDVEIKSVGIDRLSSFSNKKQIEEQLKSPKFLQKDTIDQQFSKASQQYTNQKTGINSMYLKSRHESIGNSEGITYQLSNLNNLNRKSSNNDLALQQIMGQKTPTNAQAEMQQRSLSNQGKIVYYNNSKPKKEEDVTITVEDVLDTIANVEEDADEAANLENLSGSHFKFMMKTSCKNIRIKTEQYFSKIENPSLSTFNKKQKEFQIQQQQQQMDMPQFVQNNLAQNIQNYTSNQYDPYSNYNQITEQLINVDDLSNQYSYLYTNNPYCHTINQHTHETARLNTEEVSKSIYEKHQSVETYNQINNKMTNFKNQSQLSNLNCISISPSNNQSISAIQQVQVENVLERKIKNKYSIHEKKEPGKMKKYLEENQMTDIGNRIFEGLMIYGPDKQEINNLKPSQTKEVFSLTPQLYFKYPENSQIEKGREDVFQQFAFPFGVETQQIRLTDSLSQLNEIIFSNNMAEANNNCFVFAIKSEESYKFQKNKEGSIYKQNEHQELLDICNPSNLLYGICFRVKELVENGQNKNCWKTNKLFCFLTYYPFHRFFLDIISSMLNQMKMKRIEYFSRIQENIRHDPSALSKLENEFFYNFLNKECKELLEELKKIALPSISNRLQLNFNGECFSYQVPNREEAKHIEAEWGCSLVLSSFEKELFVNIFLSLLLEQSVVFVSSNSALLSSTMLLFHSLLKPFRWHHPLIFNLPNNFTHLMDIPVPILVGLNKDKTYVYQNNLAQKHENCLFVLLDENIELLNSDLVSHIQDSLFYQHLVEKVSNYFDDLERDNTDDSNNMNYSNQNDSSNNNMSNSQNSNYKEILSHSNNNTNNANSNSQINFSNNLLGSNTKKGNSIFQQQHNRSKSFIINAATDAFNTLLGSKNKNSKSNGPQSQQFINSNSTHRRKKTIITYPNHQEKTACMKILQTCSDFLIQNIIQQMPANPPYQSNNILNFEEIEKQMIKNLGKNDSFLHNLVKTQLFTVYAEEKYELNN